ncbi:MAG: polyribonucleotide nucleotidyltransferase, partial [Planctomycetota bacterium]
MKYKKVFHLQSSLGNQHLEVIWKHFAKQATSSVIVKSGKAFLLVTIVESSKSLDHLNFVPLTVEFRFRYSSIGRIPEAPQRREGKITNEEILISRMIDRSLRPLFPKNYRKEVQVLAHLFSYDPMVDLPSLGINGASIALALSPIPWKGPVVGIPICCSENQWFLGPKKEENTEKDLDLLISFSNEGPLMVEGEGREFSIHLFLQAVQKGQEIATPFIRNIEAWKEELGFSFREESEEVLACPPELEKALKAYLFPHFQEIYLLSDLHQRKEKLEELESKLSQDIQEGSFLTDSPENLSFENLPPLSTLIHSLYLKYCRQRTVEDKIRIGGRGLDEIRPLEMEVGLLENAHGSAYFGRGDSKALVTCTLGLPEEQERISSLEGPKENQFILHYNFPPYCVGDIRRNYSPGRREIGHGYLARRAFLPVLPSPSKFFHTIRIVSDILEAHGSTSMATVCGATLAMAHGGVPLVRYVAGIGMGLIQEENQTLVLTDISASEDFLGDMDFKIAGTRKGFTAIQMDIKIHGLSEKSLQLALQKGQMALNKLLDAMENKLPQPCSQISEMAPLLFALEFPYQQLPPLPNSITIEYEKRIATLEYENLPSLQVPLFFPLSFHPPSNEDQTWYALPLSIQVLENSEKNNNYT